VRFTPQSVDWSKSCSLPGITLTISQSYGEAEILEAFKQFDKDGSGFVEEPEMRRMLKFLADDDEVVAENWPLPSCVPCRRSLPKP
jgi:hypothetical protein